MNIWWINLILYFILYVVFTQFYKISTKSSKNDGALTVLLQLLGGLAVLFFMPFFKFAFPTDIKVYIFLGLAIIFYAITDRINTTARRGLDVSTYSILGQLSTVFVITWGILFFKEDIIIKKIIGSLLILLGNIIVIYKKGKFEFNKYVLMSILGNLSMSIAISIDVGISDQFNMPIYVAATLIIPALIITLIERIKIKDIINEFKLGNKKAITIVGLTWGTMILQMLRLYQLGEVTTIAPLCSITTILNVLVAYLLLKEKDSLWKKILASIIVVLGIVLIKI
jgi:drug/metabolite transporter (DMT)-like permease